MHDRAYQRKEIAMTPFSPSYLDAFAKNFEAFTKMKPLPMPTIAAYFDSAAFKRARAAFEGPAFERAKAAFQRYDHHSKGGSSKCASE